MKKNINIIIIVAWFIMLLIPIITMNFKEGAVSVRDNRALAASPFQSSGSDVRFAKAVDMYVDDRIGFREKMISLNSCISYYIFRQSPNAKVIFGEDGWLFYNTNANKDGDVIGEYLGTKTYSEEQLAQIKENLETTEKYLNKRGCEFVLFIAPNKERMYSKYMPKLYKDMRISKENCTDQVVKYIRENTDIKVVWPYEDIKNYQKKYPDTPTYCKLDTHWNKIGGYIGARALLEELGIDIPEASPDLFTSETVNTGDLKGMISLDQLKMSDWAVTTTIYPNSDTVFEDGGFNGHWKYINDNKDTRRLFVVRDSFSSAMADVIGSEFNYADLCHNQAFLSADIETEKPDIFVYELLERYDDRLLNFVLQE